MAKRNAFNSVTPLSKAIALIMFVAFPFIGFYLGTIYQKKLDAPMLKKYEVSNPDQIKIPEGTACTMDAKICPDGSAVGRSGPNCEFAKCPGE